LHGKETGAITIGFAPGISASDSPAHVDAAFVQVFHPLAPLNHWEMLNSGSGLKDSSSSVDLSAILIVFVSWDSRCTVELDSTGYN
jgi:hypothetical protein